MSYDPEKYWTERGKTFEQEALTKGWWGAENPPLLDLLATLEFETVLEVGCGFGREGAAILHRFPKTVYTGIDVSPDMVRSAQQRLGAEVICADLATFETDRQWDLVVSVSVLGHILPKDIAGVIAKLRRWARNDLVTVDWDEVGGQTSFQFGHPYAELYGDAVLSKTSIGRLAMFHVKP